MAAGGGARSRRGSVYVTPALPLPCRLQAMSCAQQDMDPPTRDALSEALDGNRSDHSVYDAEHSGQNGIGDTKKRTSSSDLSTDDNFSSSALQSKHEHMNHDALSIDDRSVKSGENPMGLRVPVAKVAVLTQHALKMIASGYHLKLQTRNMRLTVFLERLLTLTTTMITVMGSSGAGQVSQPLMRSRRSATILGTSEKVRC